MKITLRAFWGLIITMSIQSLLAENWLDGSLASRVQTRRLNKYLMSIPSNDPKVNALQLNKQLARAGLPTIEVDNPSFRVNLALMVGFVGSNVIGAEFYDGKHKFCLPCTIGHNNFQWGITQHKLTPPHKSGDYYSYLQCLDQIPGAQVRVSDKRSSTTRFAAIPGTAEGKKGFYVYTDSKVYFYQAEMPKIGQHFISYLVTLPDGVKSAVSFRIPYDPDRTSIQDSEFETGEANREFLESTGGTDLGMGRGDKKTAEANNAILKAVSNQYENLLKADDVAKTRVSHSDICNSMDTCENVKALNGAKPNLLKFRKAFNCVTPQQRVDEGNDSKQGSMRTVE